jgi:hypothetical protein
MSFQLRHKDYGIYQGSCLGMGFWHPTSESPEQGLCEFPTTEEITRYRDFLCSPDCASPLKKEDFQIEPFDRELSERIKQASGK